MLKVLSTINQHMEHQQGFLIENDYPLITTKVDKALQMVWGKSLVRCNFPASYATFKMIEAELNTISSNISYILYMFWILSLIALYVERSIFLIFLSNVLFVVSCVVCCGYYACSCDLRQPIMTYSTVLYRVHCDSSYCTCTVQPMADGGRWRWPTAAPPPSYRQHSPLPKAGTHYSLQSPRLESAGRLLQTNRSWRHRNLQSSSSRDKLIFVAARRRQIVSLSLPPLTLTHVNIIFGLHQSNRYQQSQSQSDYF